MTKIPLDGDRNENRGKIKLTLEITFYIREKFILSRAASTFIVIVVHSLKC